MLLALLVVMKFQIKDIHERALEAASRHYQAEADLIAILQELDVTREYRDKDCKSLYQYAVKILRLSEQVALTLINVGRKAVQVPALQDAIDKREISAPTARKITSVITPENSTAWLEKAKTLTQNELEREVADVNPKEAVKEKIKPVARQRLKLEVGISEELEKKLRRVQDFESASKSTGASLEDALEAMVDVYLEKFDPVRIEKRAVERRFLRTTNRDGGENGVRTKSFCLAKREVLARNKGQCTHLDSNGKRCSSSRHLHVHHIIPREFGGDDSVDNLTVLCSGHHRMIHDGKVREGQALSPH